MLHYSKLYYNKSPGMLIQIRVNSKESPNAILILNRVFKHKVNVLCFADPDWHL